MGTPPSRALRHVEALVRFDLAADLSLDDLAAAVGYESPSWFARAFRRHEGVAPSDFRRDAQR